MNPLILPILALGGLGVLLLRRGAGPGGARRLPLSAFQRGMIIGDSHSEASWTFGGRLGEFLDSKGLETRVVGKRGWTVFRYLSTDTLRGQLEAHRPDFLIVALGANDQVQPHRADDYQDMVRRVTEIAKEAGVKRLVWFGPSKSDGPEAHRMESRRFVAGLQRDALRQPGPEGLHIEWIDSMPMTADLPTRDGVHMRRPEYLEWSRRAQSALT